MPEFNFCRGRLPAYNFVVARLSSRKSSLKIAHSKRSGVKTTRNLFVAFSLEPSISQVLLNRRAMKTGFRAVSSHAVLITCRAVSLTRNTSNKGIPGENKISNFSNKLSIRNTSSSRTKQYVRHQLSRDVDHVPPFGLHCPFKQTRCSVTENALLTPQKSQD